MSKIKQIFSLAGSAGTCGWLLLAEPIINLLTARRRDLDAYAVVDMSAAVTIMYYVVCFIILFAGKEKKKVPLSWKDLFSTPIVWFVIYTLLGFVSMIWSVNYRLTGYRAFECLTMMLLMMSVWKSLFAFDNNCKVINWCMLYVSVQVICQIVSVLKWSTDILTILGTSQMVATTFFFMAFYHPNKKLIYYLIMVMAILSGSTVAYIGMAIGLVSLFWGKSKYKLPVFAIAFIGFLAVAFIGPQKVIKDTIFYDKESISLEETSGRDQVMETALTSLKQQPQGYGFFAGEPYILYQEYSGAINGHNSFFSAAMGLGYAGVVIIFIFFIGMFRVTFSSYIPREVRQSLIGCFFVGFLHCMGNPGIGSRIYGSWMPVMLLFTLICSFYAYNRKYHNAHHLGH